MNESLTLFAVIVAAHDPQMLAKIAAATETEGDNDAE